MVLIVLIWGLPEFTDATPKIAPIIRLECISNFVEYLETKQNVFIAFIFINNFTIFNFWSFGRVYLRDLAVIEEFYIFI